MTVDQLSSWALVGLIGENVPDAAREFAFRYDRFVRRVLTKRWLGTIYRTHFDDAVQDVFVECFKPGGVLAKADSSRGGAFRSLLFRVTCNVAARYERNHNRDLRLISKELTDTHGEDSGAFLQITREEVAEVVSEALRRMSQHTAVEVRERAQLLIQHSCDGQKIIHLAGGDTETAERLHRQHSKAKREFQTFLSEVIQSHYRAPPEDVETILKELLGSLEN